MDLTKGSIIRNLVFLSLPIMLSNFMQTLYDLANAFWLGRLGADAKNAVSASGITFPVLFFLLSFGIGFMIAGTALISRYKGAGEPEKIKKTIGQLIFLLLTFVTFLVALSLIFTEQILRILQTPQEIFAISTGYMRVILISMFFAFAFFIYQSVSQGLGDTVTPMKIQIVAVLSNLLLDPLLIFGWWIIPRMETIGAAYASLVARTIASILGIYVFKRYSKDLIPTLNDLRPNWEIIKTILKVSIPSSLAMSSTSFGFVFLQGFVNTYGTVAISINSIGGRMTNLFMMPAMGISNGLAAIVGQNLGAKNPARAEKSFLYALIIVMAIMAVGCCAVYFYAGELTRFFIDDADVIDAGKRMFKLTALAAFIFGIQFCFTGVFNGSGDTKVVLMLDLIRLWIIRIPLVYILSGKLIELGWFSSDRIIQLLTAISAHLSAHPYDALWWSMIYSNIITALAGYIIYRSGRWKRVKI
jgi:putative MATE family efflux protein